MHKLIDAYTYAHNAHTLHIDFCYFFLTRFDYALHFMMTEFQFIFDKKKILFHFINTRIEYNWMYLPLMEPFVGKHPMNKIIITLFIITKQTPNIFRSTIFLFRVNTRVDFFTSFNSYSCIQVKNKKYKLIHIH